MSSSEVFLSVEYFKEFPAKVLRSAIFFSGSWTSVSKIKKSSGFYVGDKLFAFFPAINCVPRFKQFVNGEKFTFH